jgi:type IV pilus assembly protein PilY1
MDNPSDPLPSERVLSRSSVLGGLVLFTTYQPSNDICSVLGDSSLYALYYESGTAYNKNVVGTYTDGGTEYISDSTSLGQGMPTSVGVAIGETVSGFVQKSTGEIVRVETEPGLGVRSGAASWREKAGAGGAVEIETIYKHIVK